MACLIASVLILLGHFNRLKVDFTGENENQTNNANSNPLDFGFF